jgi:hypothetical protein
MGGACYTRKIWSDLKGQHLRKNSFCLRALLARMLNDGEEFE